MCACECVSVCVSVSVCEGVCVCECVCTFRVAVLSLITSTSLRRTHKDLTLKEWKGRHTLFELLNTLRQLCVCLTTHHVTQQVL